jgi:hypothetical protein
MASTLATSLLGDPIARGLFGLRMTVGVWIDREASVHDSSIETGRDIESRTGENADHLSIVGQGGGHEHRDTAPPSRLRDQIQQHCANAVMLEIVRDHKRHLCLGGAREAVVPGHGDNASTDLADECQSLDVVDAGKASHLGVGKDWVNREKSSIYRARGEVPVKGDQSGGIIGSDWPNMHR